MASDRNRSYPKKHMRPYTQKNEEGVGARRGSAISDNTVWALASTHEPFGRKAADCYHTTLREKK